MGDEKLTLDVGDATLLERALRATVGYERVVVISAALAASVRPVAEGPRTTYVINDAPERGMAHSLRLADAKISKDRALAVVLGDTPLVDADLIATIVAARGDNDVAYPVRAGIPGHPVVFGPSARAGIARLPDGDSIRTLRSDVRLRRVEVPIGDERPFVDVDTAADLARARAIVDGNGANLGRESRHSLG